MTNSVKPVVLVVEDEVSMQHLFEVQLNESVELLQAYNIEEAAALFVKNKERIACAVLDGYVPRDIGQRAAGCVVKTYELAEKIRLAGFKGPMIAISSDEGLRASLAVCGCSHECEKLQLAKLLTALLGL